MSILKNLKKIKLFLNKDTKLVVVTKNRSVREINQLLFIGATDIGENKVQEAKDKKPFVKGDAKWHMIGHLQGNKVKEAVKLFDMIQSVDSLRLASKIDLVCKSKNKRLAVLIQVNVSREPMKHGILEEELIPFMKEASLLHNIKILGLMGMAPLVELTKLEEIRPYFRRMKILMGKVKKENISGIEMKYLSMGMTNDFPIALQEGANMLRIGRAVFEK